MKPVEFKERNTVFLPAEGEEANVGNMPALVHGIAEGQAVTSCWDVSDEELEDIIKTKRVYMTVLGRPAPAFLSTRIPQR